MNFLQDVLGLIITGAVILVLLIAALIGYIMFKRSYKTAKSNEALIITGKSLGSDENVFTDETNGRRLKVVRGGGVFIKPLVQVAEPVDLTTSQLMVQTPEVYTSQGVPVVADAVAMVRIGSSLHQIANFAEQFLGKNKSDRDQEIVEVLEGHLRSALSSLTVEEIYQSRERFNEQLQEVAEKDLSKMGFEITSFALKDIRDENGYLEALGRPRIAEAKKNADIAESNAERETRIHQAQMDKEAEESEYKHKTEIAEARKNNEIRESSFKQENEKARAQADQAYALEKSINDRQLKEQEMDVRAVELSKQSELEEIEIERKEKQYEGEVKKKADAERYASQQQADADKYRTIAEAEAQAETERKRGEAEAQIIRDKGQAEAAAKEQMAEAMSKYGEAAVLEMMINMMPDFAKAVSEPMNNIDSVKVIDTGSGQGVSNLAGSVTNNMAVMQDTLKETTGIDMKALLENFAGGEGAQMLAQAAGTSDKTEESAAFEDQEPSTEEEAPPAEDTEEAVEEDKEQ
ncbi:flotillin [Salibacterium halotolerans]|uniref:Flotillin n=2 Tax=Salibacterium halotolerans TaxID=1884432 RepID=A0A1I5TNW7_9BACI|nr:flotillin family protein [Salibacterium halotolerans]SFP84730.1 flotillin [Salibacterium halotolerans]